MLRPDSIFAPYNGNLMRPVTCGAAIILFVVDDKYAAVCIELAELHHTRDAICCGTATTVVAYIIGRVGEYVPAAYRAEFAVLSVRPLALDRL
jgi:hypothetical protein